MSFNPIAAKMAEWCKSRMHGDAPAVVELGNQTVNLPDGDLNGRSAELYYSRLGFGPYYCLDVNAKHEAIPWDLNTSLRSAYAPLHFGKLAFSDLVTNNGTGEHVFNQAAVFETMHNLCRVDGLMLHILPCINWVNHGFFGFNPLLFCDLAAANGYKLETLRLGNRWGFTVELQGDRTQQVKPKTKSGPLVDAIHAVQNHERSKTQAQFPNVMVIAVLRKMQDRPFQMPVQGKYVADVEFPEIAERYSQCS